MASKWQPGKPGRPPQWAIDGGLVPSKGIVAAVKKTIEKDSSNSMKGKWGKPGRPPKWFMEEQTKATEIDLVDEVDEIDEEASVGQLSAFESEMIKMRQEAN